MGMTEAEILNPLRYVLCVFSVRKDLEQYAKKVRNAKSRAVQDEGEKALENAGEGAGAIRKA